MNELRIVFMGTAPLACASLEGLVRTPGFRVVAAVTQPDRPKGRDLRLQPSAVKELALRLELPVLQPAKARDPVFLEQLRGLAPDLVVVAAYGQLLPPALLELPCYGCLNVHTSILPRYRGAAPIQWALINGDPETGVTLMKMDPGLDTGPIVAVERTPIEAGDDAQTLHDRLAQIGAGLLVRTVAGFVSGALAPRPQPAEGVTLARKITKEDGRIDWKLPAWTLWNRVRGLTPWPGGYAFEPGAPAGRMIKVWRVEPAEGAGRPGEVLLAGKGELLVACGEGALRLLELQREGGRRLAAREFLAGRALAPGLVLE